MSDDKSITIPSNLLFEILETLRLANVYALLGSEFEAELTETGVRPHKWNGHEKEYAERAHDQYRELLALGKQQLRAEEIDDLVR